MIAKRWAIQAAVVVALYAGGVAAGPLQEVFWQADPEPGSSALDLRFQDSVPQLDIRVIPAGVAVRVPGGPPEENAPEDIEYDSSGERTEVVVRRPGSILEHIRVEGDTLHLVLTSRFAEGGSSDYRLGVSDVVTISVYQDRDLSGEYPVGQDGMVNLPLIGPVQAKGATEGELLATVRARLGEFLVEPHVSVSISAYESQFVYVNSLVTGMSRKITMSPGTSLTDVLAEAGVALIPGQEVTLSRQRPGAEASSMRMTAADLDRRQAPALEAGDILTVHPPDYVFVRGEVRQPARLLYTPGLTLQQAITMVQGLTDWASRKDVRLLRQGPDGQTELTVNLKRIENGKQPDPELESGDLVIVRRRAF